MWRCGGAPGAPSSACAQQKTLRFGEIAPKPRRGGGGPTSCSAPGNTVDGEAPPRNALRNARRGPRGLRRDAGHPGRAPPLTATSIRGSRKLANPVATARRAREETPGLCSGRERPLARVTRGPAGVPLGIGAPFARSSGSPGCPPTIAGCRSENPSRYRIVRSTPEGPFFHAGQREPRAEYRTGAERSAVLVAKMRRHAGRLAPPAAFATSRGATSGRRAGGRPRLPSAARRTGGRRRRPRVPTSPG